MRHTELPVTAQAQIGATRHGRWRVLAILAVAGAVSPGLSVASADGEARTAQHADATTTATDAQPKGTGFAVPRHVIAAGGGRSTGAVFAITGTIGQADADPLQPSTGGVFAITGGFWPGIVQAAPQSDPIFANGFEPSQP